MTGEIHYHNGKLGSLVKLVSAIIKKDPAIADDFDRLKANLFASMPELQNRERCANCDASMREYVYTFDTWDALLLLSMAQEVKKWQDAGRSFNDANQVRVPELNVPHSVKCRTTKASKLGLVAPVLYKGSKHRIPGVWLITTRGWAALRGERVPKKVKVWRKTIEERFEDTITIHEALESHKRFRDGVLERGGKLKNHDLGALKTYNASDWYDFGIHEGKLI
jgi:hypothetical protein